MTRWLFFCLFWLSGGLAAQPLLSPEALAPLLLQAQTRVVDIRDAQSYAGGHIEGAVNAPFSVWRGAANNPGLVPSLAELTALVQKLGLDPGQHAVVVSAGSDAGDFAAAARVYWTLKSMGLPKLSILNGGMQAWDFAGEPVASTPAIPAHSQWQPSFDSRWLATLEQVRQHVQRGDALLVDARPDVFYLGKAKAPTALLAGTLPGAVQQDYNQWFAPGTADMLQGQAAAQLAARLPPSPGKKIVTFCNAGHWSAAQWFALSEVLGMPGVQMYPGSMIDWTQQAQLPAMQNSPSRGEQLTRAAQQWFKRVWPQAK